MVVTLCNDLFSSFGNNFILKFLPDCLAGFNKYFIGINFGMVSLVRLLMG